ncbi:MAG: hypothetical protein R3B68_13385 [Phycisphaerales bacterium]
MQLRIGSDNVRLAAWPPRAGDDPWLREGGTLEAELRRIVQQDGGAAQLAELLASAGEPGSGGANGRGDVVARVMRALREGRMVIAPAHWRVRQRAPLSIADRPAVIEAPAPSRRVAPSKTWIGIRVVDERTGDPVSSVRLRVSLPDGTEDYYTTNASGTVRIDEIPPGTCDAACDLTGATLDDTYEFRGEGEPTPAEGAWPSARIGTSSLKRIALVDRHKVKDGDSILSIAKGAGLDWKALAKFNWGTDVPDEINKRLVDDVGVTKRSKDGKNWSFTSLDHPGVVYVPKKWEQFGLTTGKEHVFRVRLVAPLYLRLRTQESEHRVPEARYKVTWANQQEHEGKVGRSGIDLVEDPPPGEFQIEWQEQPQVLAGSLAAHARHAMDTGEQRTLLEVLKYDAETTQLMIAAYDSHFNDYSGRGLIEDMYAKFPDEEERHMLEFALLRMGVGVKSGMTLVSTSDTPHPDDVDEEFGKVGAVEGGIASVDIPPADEGEGAEVGTEPEAEATHDETEGAPETPESAPAEAQTASEETPA